MAGTLTAPASVSGTVRDALGRVSEALPLVADLLHAHLALYEATPSGPARLVAQERPGTVPPVLRRPTGPPAQPVDLALVARVVATGRPIRRLRRESVRGVPTLLDVWPVPPDGSPVAAVGVEVGLLEDERLRQKSGIFRRALDQLRRAAFAGELAGAASIGRLDEHDAPLVADTRGSILYISSNAENLYRKLGYTQSLLGRNVTSLRTDESSFVRAVETGACVEQTSQEGGLTWVRRAIPLRIERRAGWFARLRGDQSDVDGVLLLVRDVTGDREREQALRIKSALIHEVHHRVKNNLQTIAALLRLQARRSASAEVSAVLRQAINRILSIAVVHEYLAHEDDSLVNLRDVCQRIVHEIQQGLPDALAPIRFAVEGVDLLLPAQQATSCALIVNELVQNSIKHAFVDRLGGIVRVLLLEEATELSIEVVDNGAGPRRDGTAADGQSLGLQIVRTLVRDDLKGRFALEAGPAGGARAIVTFPSARASGG